MPSHLVRLVAAAITLAALAFAPTAQPASHDDAPDGDRPTTARGRTVPRYQQSVTTQEAVETSWGTLRGEVRRPLGLDGTPLTGTPVVLQVSPYGILNEGLSLYDDVNADATADYFVTRGYAYAIFDAVGTHASGGCTAFGGLPERESTAELVDDLGSRDWTNGNVGMIGASYDGTLAIAAAVEAPEHLKAIIPQVAIDRWYDYMFDDGVRMGLEDVTGRGGAIPADPPLDSPADYDTVYGVVPDHTQSPEAVAGATVEHLQPCNRVQNQLRGYEQDPVYDQFWVDRDYRALAGNVTAAVLFEGAWLDDNVKHEAGPSFVGALPEDTPKHLVMGQWTHSTSRFSDAMDLRHAWFDQYLLGLDTGVDELATHDSQADDGERRQSMHWPPAHATVQQVVLVGDDPDWGGAGPLSWGDLDKALVEERLVRTDELDPCATGTVCRRITGPAATAPFRVTGTPRLTVDIATSSTHLAPVLIEVLPDGTRQVVARGFLDTRNRNGLDRSEPHDLERFSATVELWPVDIVVEQGGALELVLASTNATFGVPDGTTAMPVVHRAVLDLPVTHDVDADVVAELVTIDDLP